MSHARSETFLQGIGLGEGFPRAGEHFRRDGKHLRVFQIACDKATVQLVCVVDRRAGSHCGNALTEHGGVDAVSLFARMAVIVGEPDAILGRFFTRLEDELIRSEQLCDLQSKVDGRDFVIIRKQFHGAG